MVHQMYQSVCSLPDSSSPTGCIWNTAASDQCTGSDIMYRGPWGHSKGDASWQEDCYTQAILVSTSPESELGYCLG